MFPGLGPPGAPVARAAVVAGTATAVATGVARHQQKKDAREDAEGAVLQESAASQAVAPAGEADYVVELRQLAELKASGLVTQDEFDAKKKQILGI